MAKSSIYGGQLVAFESIEPLRNGIRRYLLTVADERGVQRHIKTNGAAWVSFKLYTPKIFIDKTINVLTNGRGEAIHVEKV